MKALILTMTCGEGHNSIAKNFAEFFKNASVETEIVDIYRAKKFDKWINNQAYLLSCKYIPKIYHKIWTRLKYSDPDKRRYKNTFQMSIKCCLKDVENEIKSFRPDFILCTHFNASGIVDRLRRENRIDKNIKLFSYLTDFYPHPCWEDSIGVDYVFIINSCAEKQLVDKGFKKEQLVEVGFPVNARFFEKTDKREIRKKLGLDENLFTVMVSSGGFGIGRNYNVLKKLLLCKSKVQIVIANGHNKSSFVHCQNIIKSKNLTNVLNLGFAGNMHELMGCSDVSVSRGGCATLCEAIAKNVPVIARENIIINEAENADFLQQRGCCVRLKKLDELPKIIDDLNENRIRYKEMSEACNGILKTDTLQNVLNFIKSVV